MKQNKDKDSTFLDAAKKTLDRQQDDIDDATLSALRNIRRQAIKQAETRPGRTWFQQPLYPALAAAAGIVVILTVTLSTNLATKNSAAPSLDDMAMLTASDDLSFYQNIEFYQWLDAKRKNG